MIIGDAQVFTRRIPTVFVGQTDASIFPYHRNTAFELDVNHWRIKIFGFNKYIRLILVLV